MRRQESPVVEDDLPLSKTRQKEAMQALQKLGGELIELSRDQLKRINLPEDLLVAVLDWQRFTKHEAKRRQLQYIGRLMRSLDPAPIEAGLALLRGESAEETARLHRLERLRDRLLDDDKVLQEIAASWPQADIPQLRQLRRNALKEKAENRPPKNFRAIFQALKALEQGSKEPAGEAEGEAGDEPL